MKFNLLNITSKYEIGDRLIREFDDTPTVYIDGNGYLVPMAGKPHTIIKEGVVQGILIDVIIKRGNYVCNKVSIYYDVKLDEHTSVYWSERELELFGSKISN